MSHERVLLDSDALIGWITATDDHHARAVALFEIIKQRRMQPVVTNLVIAETASLLSVRQSQAVAQRFMTFVQSLQTIIIDEHLHRETVRLFLTQTRNKTSFTDMANVVVVSTYEIPLVFAFDKVYSRDFNLPMLSIQAA